MEPLNLLSRRKALSLSREALGRKTGFSAKSIARWESGRAIHPEYRRKLERVLLRLETRLVREPSL